MELKLKGKHFITNQDWSIQELEKIFDFASVLKKEPVTGQYHHNLEGKSLGMIFFDPSTRTRTSFEVAMTQLGGHGIYFAPETMQISHGEAAKDTAKVLSGYLQGIAVRYCKFGKGNQYLDSLKQGSSVPIVNMQCDIYHPAQILADYLTIREVFGHNTRGLKLGVSWTYAPNYLRPLSVPQSLILMMPRFGIDVTLAYPQEFKLMDNIVEQARQNAKESGTKFIISHEMEDAFKDADIVIPKSWGPMMHTDKEEEGLALIEEYPEWVCDAKRMALTQSNSIYMHPLPADRGKEVTDSVIDGPHSVVYQEAENRLHVQKALLALIL
jgi:N-acetylornithine carbamoyltransferase